MKTNRWMERSQRFYLRLLHLYPHAYRERYEMQMFCVFKDQLREAYKEYGNRGILSLWPRTLVDVGMTAVSEHLVDPQASLGLLQVNPNAPLPWKGVLLVLIPGLIFFGSQIAQLTTDNDWFFIAFYRAAYYLIAPVLLVWLLTRRFPVWGLIPLGLLYKVVGSYPPDYLLGQIPFLHKLLPLEVDPYRSPIPLIDLNYFLPIAGCIILLCAFIWYTARQGQFPRTAWRWMAVYSALMLFQMGAQIYRFRDWQGWDWSTAFQDTGMDYYLIQMLMFYLYEWLPFLLLVFIGAVFARKYSGISFLLLLGYLLPTIVFGRYGEWNNALPFALVSTAVLVYRFIVALVAPVWLVRAASTIKRQRAAAIPIAVAILTHIALNVIAFIASAEINSYQPTLLDFAMIIWDQFILAAGLGLAVALYLPEGQKTLPPPALVPVAE